MKQSYYNSNQTCHVGSQFFQSPLSERPQNFWLRGNWKVTESGNIWEEGQMVFVGTGEGGRVRHHGFVDCWWGKVDSAPNSLAIPL